MNAYSKTFTQIEQAFGPPQFANRIHKAGTTYSKGGCFHTITWLETGERYRVDDQDLRNIVQHGDTPDDLGLFPLPERDEDEPFGGDYCHTDHFRQLRGRV